MAAAGDGDAEARGDEGAGLQQAVRDEELGDVFLAGDFEEIAELVKLHALFLPTEKRRQNSGNAYFSACWISG